MIIVGVTLVQQKLLLKELPEVRKSAQIRTGSRLGQVLLDALVIFVSSYFNLLPQRQWWPVKWNEGSFHEQRKAVVQSRCTKIDLEAYIRQLYALLLSWLLVMLNQVSSFIYYNRLSHSLIELNIFFYIFFTRVFFFLLYHECIGISLSEPWFMQCVSNFASIQYDNNLRASSLFLLNTLFYRSDRFLVCGGCTSLDVFTNISIILCDVNVIHIKMNVCFLK